MSMPALGHNNPPGPIDNAMDTAVVLSRWLAERPVILDEDMARDGKLLLDRAKASAGEIEDARTKETKPLNEQLGEINARYKQVHNADPKKPGMLDKVVNELRRRLTDYLAKEEAARLIKAEAAKRAAENAARIAREAEQKEFEAIENAQAGELGVDVTQVVVEANSKFAEYQKAEREAQRAERDTHVRLGGGWERAATLKDKETLVLESYSKAIKAIGPHHKIEAAILSAAREYRTQTGHLPEGVISQITRAI